jgi:hypothetical protein
MENELNILGMICLVLPKYQLALVIIGVSLLIKTDNQ